MNHATIDTPSQGTQAAHPFMQAHGICKSFLSAAGRETILGAVQLSVGLGEVLAITAPSGAGKSTLLKILGTLEKPDAGTLCCGGEMVDFRNGRQLAQLRARSIGFVFQRFNLVPFLTAQENVELPLKLRRMTRQHRRRQAQAALALVGLEPKRMAMPATLSGGEQQRVAIARAIVGAPSLLLCDEPTGSLGEQAGQQIFELLYTFAQAHRRAVVLVTHNESLARQATRRLYLHNGALQGLAP
ncbi:ABC transporter ATP-binding protein [Massilia sp. CCM 8734]|uniref:ABC transporter ATP-binding protein n=1 Tax=Massilia sp. CCM 8734 TaxID=2609283 RepID=UPI00142470D2|nr:ABC transporter ATP-binding protein [Massilia sp. CCM 8734]NHZ94744.1 ATP-binding cassette domain-containing protein [Massilia sp. CCM 8734]